MTDEALLTAAKLREQIKGELEGDTRLLDHTAYAEDKQDRTSLSFVESVSDGSFADTKLGREIASKMITDTATRAVQESNASVMSHLVGVTERDLDASSMRLPLRLLEQMDNNDAPAFVTAAGNPNTGKTNTMLLLAELRKLDLENLEVVSNFGSTLTDHRVTSAHDLMVTLLELRDVPKFVLLDEASTHFDARTYNYEVSTQWTPLAKRFAKINVDVCGVVVHTGKDLHPECKRLATLPFFKHEKKRATFFDNWPADADMPMDELFSGDLENLEATSADYDADDAAPWSWNLEPELFALDLDWPELLTELRERGPDN